MVNTTQASTPSSSAACKAHSISLVWPMQHIQLERETETPCKSTAFNMSNEGGDYHDEHDQLHRSIISRPAGCRQEKQMLLCGQRSMLTRGVEPGAREPTEPHSHQENSFTDLLFVSNGLKEYLNPLPHSPFALCQSFSRLGLD
jgi:hypothetical protein